MCAAPFRSPPSQQSLIQHFNSILSSGFKPFLTSLRLPLQMDVSKTIKNASTKLLNAFVDSVFEFVDQPFLPSQSNFAPVNELREAVTVTSIEGEIPDDFPEGIYIRNGTNPLYGVKPTKSLLGRSNTECKTFKIEKQLNKRSFLPAVEGDSLSVLSAYLLNWLRFGEVNKLYSNTSVIEHSGKFYAIAENGLPQEIDSFTLETLGTWDVNEARSQPFTSHPKRAPGTSELVIMGFQATKPFVEVGVVSTGGKKLLHKVDLKLNRGIVSSEIGVTESYTVFLDCPISTDINRLVQGGPLIKFKKDEYARIGIMPRYGDVDSIKWFDVKPNCTYHIINCFEDGNEIVVWGCRALESIIPGPDFGKNIFEWFSSKFRPIGSVGQSGDAVTEDALIFSRPYEWRLDMHTGDVKERNLTGTEFGLDFPIINEALTGLKNKCSYMQVVDSIASSAAGMPTYGGLARLYFEELNHEFSLRKG
ncbi:hypothetical protein SLA2020_005920 [Shorea laevis]